MDRASHYFEQLKKHSTPSQYLPTQPASASRASNAVSYDDEFPLDEFDRALLAESPSSYGTDDARMRLATVAVAPRIPKSVTGDQGSLRAARLQSSSPTFYPSSPTIMALQNRKTAHQRVVQKTSADFLQPADDFNANENNVLDATTMLYPSKIDLSHAPSVVQGIRLVKTSVLSDNMRSVFKFPLFNAIQSKCFPHAYESDDNLVLSAPTGSGKTAVMELAICRLLMHRQGQDVKVVYQTPTKSLCSERKRDWSKKFNTLGLQCAELTGDVELSHLKSVQRAHIIIATPEKWDSVTRKWKDNAKLMRMIKLFMVDEVHMLKESRGATLEAIVSRMKSVGGDVRFVALSATVPNSEDIAAWLGLNTSSQHLPAIREVFGESFRSTELEKHVIGFAAPPNDFIFDGMLVKEIPAIIARYSKRKPVMIFCPTRKSATKMAQSLSALWLASSHQARLWDAPRKQLKVMDGDLQHLMPSAVAFHHSGLDTADRHAVETAFLNRDINVVCSTSTLAVGVNLPCYLVILKGTTGYSDQGMQEYSILEVMQMLGRAGRPQFEKSACAVILTQKDKVERYEKLITGQDLVESCLHQNLIEHLNSEIGIGTIHDITSARRWLKGTFLAVRAERNPGYYRLEDDSRHSDIEALLQDICERDMKRLEEARLIEQVRDYRCTDLGHAMARYYVQFETMKIFISLPPKARVSEILNVLVQAVEFKELRWKAGEKSLYKKINRSNEIRFPVKVDISLPAHKASLAIQAALGGFVLDKTVDGKHGQQFSQDTSSVLTQCNRLIRCIIDIQLSLKDATSAKNALELGRSIAAGVWDNTPMQLKQIAGIGDATARKLSAGGIMSLDALSNTEACRIDVIMGKNPPYGKNLLSKLANFPSLRVTAKEKGQNHKPNAGVEIYLQCELGFLNEKPPTYFNQRPIYICFLCESSHGELLDFRRFGASRLAQSDSFQITTLLHRPTKHIRCHVMCDEIAGTHCYAEVTLDVPSAWFSPKPSVSINEQGCGLSTSIAQDERFDEFDDIELQDEDLLTVDNNFDGYTRVVEDIDKILEKTSNAQSCKGDKKRKSSPKDDSEQQAEHWRPPTRLPNGNWTCQHECMEEGKNCKHQCCKEGVKRPKKQPKISESNSNVSGVTSGYLKLDEGLTQIKQVEKAQKPTRSIKQILGRISKIDAESATPSTHEPEHMLARSDASSIADRQHQSAGTLLPEMAAAPLSDLPELEHLIDNTSGSSRKVPAKVDEHEGDGSGDELYGDCSEFLDPAECDWLPVETFNDQFSADSQLGEDENQSKRLLARTYNNRSPHGHSLKALELGRPASVELEADEAAPIFSPSKGNLGGPAEKQADTHARAGNNGMVANDNLELVAYDFSDIDMPEAEYTGVLNGKVNPRCETDAATTNADHGELSHTDKQGAESSIFIRLPEREAEKRRRLAEHAEDQRKKWAELEPWMYEAFGQYVDLV